MKMFHYKNNMKSIMTIVLMGVSHMAFAGGGGDTLTLSDSLKELSDEGQVPLPPSMDAMPLPDVIIDFPGLLPVENPFCEIAQAADPEGAMFVFNSPGNDSFQENFSFQRTLNAIVEFSGGNGNAVTLAQSLLDGYDLSSMVNSDSNISMALDVRPGERDLDAQGLVVGDLKPTALFNRLDLAAADGSHCGEQRIVYHLDSAHGQAASGRFFLIFEAQYPNPKPEEGVAGCRQVAEFWAGLSEIEDAEAQVQLLSDFFYTGIPDQDGVGLPPVVTFNNYQTGQVRTNHFINFVKWQLREYRTGFEGNTAIFAIDTVKDNPLAELYASAGANPELEAEFLQEFESAIDRLMGPELAGLSEPEDIIDGIRLHTDGKFDEFQSDAQGIADDPVVTAGGDMRLMIEARLAALGLDEFSADMVLNRAGSQTCGGCHETTALRPIAPGILWPTSNRFVHVSEDGRLSAALRDVFLPKRHKVLTNYICSFSEPPTGGETELRGADQSDRGIVSLSWLGVPGDSDFTYFLKRGDKTLAQRKQGKKPEKHLVLLGVEPVGKQVYHLEVCRGEQCNIVSPKKVVEVLKAKLRVPKAPEAPARSTSGLYKIGFNNLADRLAMVTLLENGNPVMSHTISGGATMEQWTRSFAADHRGEPGTYVYQVRSCNGGACALSDKVAVKVSGGYGGECPTPGPIPLPTIPSPEPQPMPKPEIELPEIQPSLPQVSIEEQVLVLEADDALTDVVEIGIPDEPIIILPPIDCEPPIVPLPILIEEPEKEKQPKKRRRR